MIQDWTPADLKNHLDQRESVFLKLWKEGCGACKLSAPAVERLESANEHGLVFAQISVTDHPEIMELADSDVLPLFFVFKDQKLAGKVIGFKGIAKLQEMISQAFKP
jgi:thioredoxin 1